MSAELQDVFRWAKSLCEDPLFVHRVGVAAIRYRDDKASLAKLPKTKEELKAPHQKAVEAARAFRVAMREYGVDDDSAEMRAAGARIVASNLMLEDIEKQPKRLDYNHELDSLARRLAEVFDAYSIPQHKLTSFIESIKGQITPPTETAPSKSSIEKAVRSARKPRS